MKIVVNNKTLWHVQADIDWHDDTYDMFILSEQEPTQEEIAKIYCDENGIEMEDQEVKDFLEYYNVYNVYAEEIGIKK